ncbi:Terpene synthase [Rhizoctonia solani]|uniref:Terpene synthase n=1 Tax=Rhizoctonia solani TaxID=456999 RepID=A0A8H7HCE0_9AGAM|nr:Terpene synthase [Rhizoctonia solani]
MVLATPITEFTVPDIAGYTSDFFISKCNPHLSEGETTAHVWFDTYEIYSGVKRDVFFESRFCLLAALSYPDADLEHIRPAMDFILWTFAFDDMADKGELDPEGLKRTVKILINAIRNPDIPPSEIKIVAMLQSIINRMRINGSCMAIQHVVEAVEDFSQAVIKESSNKNEDCVETIDQYISTRRDTSAVKQVYAMMEYAHCLDLPNKIRLNPTIVELGVAGNDILSWANDIYSFPVEDSRGQLHNFVYVAMHNNRVDLQGAVDYVYQRIQARLEEYMALKAQLPSFGSHIDSQVARYVQGIEYTIQACIEWYFLTPRYLGTNAKEAKETNVVKLLQAPAIKR